MLVGQSFSGLLDAAMAVLAVALVVTLWVLATTLRKADDGDKATIKPRAVDPAAVVIDSARPSSLTATASHNVPFEGFVRSKEELRARLLSSSHLLETTRARLLRILLARCEQLRAEHLTVDASTISQTPQSCDVDTRLIFPNASKVAWAIDCETTGLGSDDRIVSFGAAEIQGDTPTGRVIHLVFDPGRNSHPMARRMHGWSDWVLRHQPFFSEHAAELFQVLSNADFIIGHNVEFDLAFLSRELRAAGQPHLIQGAYCTMRAYKDRFPGERGSLDDCIAKIGGQRQSARHGALEDAVLSVSLYRWLAFGHPQVLALENWLPPSNLREHPPEPSPPWPVRKRRPRQATLPPDM